MIRLKIREIAEQQGYTISKLARHADLGTTTVRAIWYNATADPQLSTLLKIAKVLQVQIWDLFEEIKKENKSPYREGRKDILL